MSSYYMQQQQQQQTTNRRNQQQQQQYRMGGGTASTTGGDGDNSTTMMTHGSIAPGGSISMNDDYTQTTQTTATLGDESSVVRIVQRHNHTIQKKGSDVSGYQFGNSSVGGNSSIRHSISYNPTINTNGINNSNHHLTYRGGNNNNNSTYQQMMKNGSVNTMNDQGSAELNLTWTNMCGCCPANDFRKETLEYNYALEQQQQSTAASNGDVIKKPIQPYPRIRTRGEYYIDTFNDEPWSFTMGTNELNGTWCNSSDQAGTIMSGMVWVLMLYSAFTVTALTITEGIPVTLGMIYAFLVFMALASHAKTSFTDPGSVPVQAIPSERQRLLRDSHSMCGQCQTFKPPGSHHCRICNRCISRMDHHCPWMNNCVGAGNLKHFCLFLFYTWLCAAYSLLLFGWNYFFCSDEDCTFHPVVLHLVRLMTLLAIGAFLFTSSMLMNVCYGIMTGIGTIDRLKKKATNTMSQSDEEPIQLIDVFGIGGFYTWFLPIDPIFDEYDRVMGYTIPSRLDRERQFCDLVMFQQQQQQQQGVKDGDIKTVPSMEFPNKCVNDLLPV